MEAFDALYESPVGWLGIQLQDHCLTSIAWLRQSNPQSTKASASPQAKNVIELLDAYFHSVTFTLSIELAPSGTDFQRRVWKAIQAIQPGSVKTYGELARDLATGSRAIGRACRYNPIPIIIPCHRVVASNGIGGFMGNSDKVHIKQWLLQHEKFHWY